MEIFARFNYQKIDHTQDSTAHLVVSLKTPSLSWIKSRPALCVVPVVDLSGSMRGPKLDYAKKSLLKLVDHLQIGDVAGLIAFESRVHTLVAPREVTPELKIELRQAIEKMKVLGGTNFADGLLKALNSVQSLDLSPKFLKRVIMFTDGQPTEGILDSDQILNLVDKRRGSITVSAFGYGDAKGGIYNGCDPEFLTRFSEKGCGNFAYVKDPDDALGAFAKELGGLLSTYATDLVLEIEPVGGNQVTKVVTDVQYTKDITGTGELKVPDILTEETRHFVFETKLGKQSKAFPRETTAFNVSVVYSMLTEDGQRESRKAECKARVQFVRPGDVDKSPVREVDEIVDLHKMVRAQIEAEELAKKGQFQAASLHMNSFADATKTKGYVNVAAAAAAVSDRVGSSMSYSAGQGFLRSLARGTTRAYGVASMDNEALALLDANQVVASNTTMTSMEESFTADVEDGSLRGLL